MADPVVYYADFRSVVNTAPYFTFTANCYDGKASNDTCTISINAKYNSPKGAISNSAQALTCEIWVDHARQTSIAIGPGGAYNISGKTSLDLGTYYYTVKRGNGGTSRNCHIGAYVSLSGIYWSGKNLGSKNADTSIATPSIPVEHTCYFNGNGSGSTVTAATAVKVYGKQLSMPSASRPGYNFLGWSTVSDATTATYPGNSLQWTPDESITYYAVWELAEISWSMDCSSLYDSHTLVWSSDTDEPTIAFSSSTVPTVKFKINTSGTVSNFKYCFLGDNDTSMSVSANTQYTVPFANAIYQLNNQSDKSIVSTSISGSFTLSQGSNSFTKTFSRSVSFVIGTAVSDVKANLIYCYKTSATNCKLKYKLTLPMVGDSKFNSSSTNRYTSIMDMVGQYTQDGIANVASSSTFTSADGSNELTVDSTLTLKDDNVKSIAVCLPKLMINSPSSAVPILTVNIAPYASQDILLKKDKTVECVEIIETDKNEIAFQKGGRLYCKEFIETGEQITSDIFVYSSDFDVPSDSGPSFGGLQLAGYPLDGQQMLDKPQTGIQILAGTTTTYANLEINSTTMNDDAEYSDNYIPENVKSLTVSIGAEDTYFSQGGTAAYIIRNSDTESVAEFEATSTSNMSHTFTGVAGCYLHVYMNTSSGCTFTRQLLKPTAMATIKSDIPFNKDYSIEAIEFIEKEFSSNAGSNVFNFGTPYNDGAVHLVNGFNLQADVSTNTLHISGGTGMALDSTNLTVGVDNYMPIDGDVYIDLAASSALPSNASVSLTFTDSETTAVKGVLVINSTNQMVSKVLSVKKSWYVKAFLVLPASAAFTSTLDVLISVHV